MFPINWERLDAGVFTSMLPATKRKSRTFATRETDVISERKHCSRRRRHTQVELSSSRKCADKTLTIARKRWHGARKRKRSNLRLTCGRLYADKEGTTAIVDKYRKLLKKTKEARVEQIILSGILPVFGNRIDGYRNSKRMAINGMVKRLCKEEDVGCVDLWDSFVGKEEMYVRDGLHLSGKGAAVFAEGLSGAVASGLDKVRYLN